MAALFAALLLTGCAGSGGPGKCRIEVLGVETWDLREGGLDVSYLVGGEAGSPAMTWLVANPGGTNPIPGGGVEIEPGLFKAEIALKLTGVPREFAAMLEVNDPTQAKPRRCKATAKIPDGG